MSLTISRPVSALLLACALTWGATARAHEGHDHGDAPPPPIVAATPTLEATSPDFELVATVDGDALLIYLDRFADNAPVNGATIEASGNGESLTAEAVAGQDGVYRLKPAWLGKPGRHDLTFLVASDAGSDLLIGALDIPAPPPAPALPAGKAGPGAFPVSQLLGAGAVFALGFGCALLLTRRRSAALAISGVLALAAASPLGATEAPRRLPDGGIYAPKATQRLLGLRTVTAEVKEVAQTVQLIGQAVLDPDGGGHVQATQVGRIEPAESGLPHVGQVVAAGETLAYIAPAVNVVDSSGIRQQIAAVEQELVIAESRLGRLKRLEGSVPQRDVEEAEATLNGLRRRREALSPTLTVREALRAPIAGVVAASNVKAGQVVDGRDQVLFEIVDPARLMVEAVAFDPRVAAEVHAGTAVGADGRSWALTHIGHSPTLRRQAIPVLFRIDGSSAGLSVGQPLRITAQIKERASGVALPKESVVRDGAGRSIVWLHVGPQRFAPAPVRTRPIDGAFVLVEAGVAPGARVVADGAGLLNQIR